MKKTLKLRKLDFVRTTVQVLDIDTQLRQVVGGKSGMTCNSHNCEPRLPTHDC